MRLVDSISGIDPEVQRALGFVSLGSIPILLFAVNALTHPLLGTTPPSLYLQMAESVSNAGFLLPYRVPYYTESGIPFAYPPLAFYVLAAVGDLTGWSYFTAARALSLAYNVGYVFAFYALAREILSTPRQAWFAAFVFAVSPGILRWHLFASGGAGGSVRALGYLFCILTVLSAYRYYSRPIQQRRYLVYSGVGFGLVLLTHPMYVPFTGVSVMLMYLVFDRGVSGFKDGVLIAGLGLVLASPWWLTVLSRHGVSVFLGASATHNGIGQGLLYLPITSTKLWSVRATQTAALSAWYLTPLGVAYLLAKREWFLPLWLGVALVLNTEQRFHFLVEILVAGVFLFDGFLPWLRREAIDTVTGHYLVRGLLAMMIVFAGVSGVLFATGIYQNVYAQQYDRVSSVPSESTIDEHRAAGVWIEHQTNPSATFVVVGPEEDVPYYAKRTVLVVPWGSEWAGPDAFIRQKQLLSAIEASETASSLSRVLGRHELYPDYVYVSRDSFDEKTLFTSVNYRVVFENSAVVVARVVSDNVHKDGYNSSISSYVSRADAENRHGY